MKDIFIQKVTQIPSCLTDSAEASLDLLGKVSEESLAQRGGYRQFRRSAAMIGLAISMSATGMVLSEKANATAGTGNPQAALADLSNSVESEMNSAPLVPANQGNSAPSIANSLKSPTLKYSIQKEQSNNNPSQELPVQPIAIAASNNISSESDLVTGQSLKVPATNIENPTPKSQSIETALAPSVIQNPRNLNPSLRPFPNRDREGVYLNNNKNIAPVESTSSVPEKNAIADVADVSQPLQVIPAQQNQTTDQSALRQRPSDGQVTVAIAAFDYPIPIAVPTPESLGVPSPTAILPPQTKAPIPLSSPPTILSLPRKPENNSSNQSSQAIAISKLEAVGNSSTPPHSYGELNAPIVIPVPSPELESATIPPAEISPPVQQELTNQVAPSSNNNISDNQSESYAIKPGDTINSIAQQYGLSSTEIIKANRLSDPNLIKVNQNLVIPSLPQTQSTDLTAIAPLPVENNSWETIPAPMALAAPRNLVKPVESPTAIPIVVDEPTATYTNQLKKKVAHLQQSYGNESRLMTIPIQRFAQVSHSQDVLESEEINPEWSNKSNVKTVPTRSLPKVYQAPQTSLQKLQQKYPYSVKSSGASQTQIVGSAPIDAEDYNNNFSIPVGREVSPDLPPLSTPNFPDAPTNLTGGYIWPAKGVLSSGYGRRWGKMHKGIDIAAPIGTPIMASAPGEVIAAGWNSGGYGNLVKIRHADGSVTFYAHNSRVLVRAGQEVTQGEQISEMGSTGRSTGPHLHFEVRPNGETAANPIAFLPNSQSNF